MTKKSKNNIPLCACDCGQPVTIYRGKPRKYISGHNARVHNPMVENKEESVEKMRQTSLEKYGVDWPSKSEQAKKKSSDAKLGDKNPSKRPEVREKISKSCIGRIPYNKGLTKDDHPSLQSASEKMSDENNPMYGITGDEHPSYNSNLTDEHREKGRFLHKKELKNWIDAVFKRDNYTCQICGDNRGGNLISHHKNSYSMFPEERFIVKNGVTLCEKCHKEFHDIYGYGNNTEAQYIEYLLTKGILKDA